MYSTSLPLALWRSMAAKSRRCEEGAASFQSNEKQQGRAAAAAAAAAAPSKQQHKSTTCQPFWPPFQSLPTRRREKQGTQPESPHRPDLDCPVLETTTDRSAC